MQSAGAKRVVIVGGGVAGTQLVKLLENVAAVTLIDPKDYFEVPYSALRCLVEPRFAERPVIVHSAYMKKSQLLMASAADATRTEVTTDSGTKVPYDFLVICTGSAYVGPKTRQDRLVEYQKANRKLVDARGILIIGGGPVGVELAGEVITDFPTKKVTIVTSSSRLLEFLGPKAADKASKWLKKKGVQIIYNDKVDPSTKVGNTYTTRAAIKVEAELHFWCVGKRLGNAWLENSEFKSWLDGNGRLRVDSTLRLVDVPNVFCAGDMTDIKEIKQGYLASQHAQVIAENIKKLIKDPSTKKLSVYKRMEEPMGLVTLGRHIAVGQFPCCTCIGCLPAMMKNKDLFVGSTRKSLGLPF